MIIKSTEQSNQETLFNKNTFNNGDKIMIFSDETIKQKLWIFAFGIVIIKQHTKSREKIFSEGNTKIQKVMKINYQSKYMDKYK